MMIIEIQNNYSDHNLFQIIFGKAEIEHNYWLKNYELDQGQQTFSVMNY